MEDSYMPSTDDATAEDSSVDISGEVYHQESHAIDGGTTTDRDTYGGSVIIDYPDSWAPDGADSTISVSLEAYYERQESIDDGTHTESSSWGGDASVDY
ncbi:hypothetical protein QEZ54_08755 [Catellatospora sp. KI3]|uniref:hypothetical protein n=1 Tax=Catellatospora sp. KI3 TaxID=3041620 RepID=UPI00248225B9|nr:hypothetical protein [Catellatospora sp. KI3]MDI1461052.1 hypothetical protein [Catellatospora sp. KI3]